jgi:hypothetical protein
VSSGRFRLSKGSLSITDWTPSDREPPLTRTHKLPCKEGSMLDNQTLADWGKKMMRWKKVRLWSFSCHLELCHFSIGIRFPPSMLPDIRTCYSSARHWLCNSVQLTCVSCQPADPMLSSPPARRRHRPWPRRTGNGHGSCRTCYRRWWWRWR